MRSADEAGLPADPEFRVGVRLLHRVGLAAGGGELPAGSPPTADTCRCRSWDWGCAGPPGWRISALAAGRGRRTRPRCLPGPDEPVSFAEHVKGLFRPIDRQSMKFAFDLWAYDDVAANAHGDPARLREGRCRATAPGRGEDGRLRTVDPDRKTRVAHGDVGSTGGSGRVSPPRSRPLPSTGDRKTPTPGSYRVRRFHRPWRVGPPGGDEVLGRAVKPEDHVASPALDSGRGEQHAVADSAACPTRTVPRRPSPRSVR